MTGRRKLHTGCDEDGHGLFRQDDAGVDVVRITGVVVSAVVGYKIGKVQISIQTCGHPLIQRNVVKL